MSVFSFMSTAFGVSLLTLWARPANTWDFYANYVTNPANIDGPVLIPYTVTE